MTCNLTQICVRGSCTYCSDCHRKLVHLKCAIMHSYFYRCHNNNNNNNNNNPRSYILRSNFIVRFEE
jgi:hypothetical protein